jgi:hypothetical protein
MLIRENQEKQKNLNPQFYIIVYVRFRLYTSFLTHAHIRDRQGLFLQESKS